MKKHQPTRHPFMEELYAKINKPSKDQRPQSEPEVLYAQVKKSNREQRSQSEPEINPYAPQKPLNLEGAYAVPRGGPNPKKLVDPYAITDLKELEGTQDPYHLENPLYESSGGRQPEKPEHVYAELEFGPQRGQQPPKPVESVYATVGMGSGGPDADHKKHQPTPLPSNPEVLYAKVNKPSKDQRPQSEPEVLYAQVKKSNREQRPQSEPEINPYAPQKPLNLEGAYAVPRGGPNPKKLVDPYAITDLKELEWKQYPHQLKNPLYESSGGWQPEKPEHVYAELEFDPQRGQQPPRPVESVYATVGMGSGGPDADYQENPIYQGVEKSRRTPPPRTQKDLLTSGLAQNPNFQYGALEVQEWCVVVYGNRHALNKELAKILENPKQGQEILQNLLENPESVGKLAGQKLFGVKSPARKDAEEGIGPLCDAFERHIKTAKKIHKDLTKNLERGQRSPEHGHHHQHQQHHERGRKQGAQQQEHQRSRTPSPKGAMAFAM
ncbi:BID domain-containing T4SS effector [Bartonella vinsonii]|uniref:BID domain-containing T4SS effector n=1 Tax=Bartonella vinsonii TaxID=33047 RepID=UPI0002B6EC8B|nr:BID domain-containing T4SS effector [Bartonella vinsonii]AGF76315.1 Bep protein [Bartonella vinsonii subsp. berkhoffii str. Winnie]